MASSRALHLSALLLLVCGCGAHASDAPADDETSNAEEGSGTSTPSEMNRPNADTIHDPTGDLDNTGPAADPDDVDDPTATCSAEVWPDVAAEGQQTAWAQLAPITESFEPSSSSSILWLDQQAGINQPPRLQRWGQVFTVPASAGTLVWLSVYVRADTGGTNTPATYFRVRLTEWSDELQEPDATVLYQSERVSFSEPNTNPADPESQIHPTVFEMNAAVTPGKQYFVELAGDGGTAVPLAEGYRGSDGLYLMQDCAPWGRFGEYALLSDVAFSEP